jgi:putative ABC transport system permease protein
MRRARAWFGRLRDVFGRARREREFAEEIETHVAMRAEDHRRAGLPEMEARRRALVDLGGVEQVLEERRLGRGVPVLERLAQDARGAVRSVRKNPGFSALAILTLALGIGANTAIFSLVSALLLRPLPFDEPDRLVQVWHTPPQEQFPGLRQFSVSPANFLDWRARSRVFERMAAYSGASVSWSGEGGRPESLTAALVQPDFFPLMRVRPRSGRFFLPEEETPGRDRVAILSERLWRSRFGGDAGVVGTSLRLGGEPYTIVGIMPAEFRLPAWADLWLPLAWTDKEKAVRGIHDYRAIARLAPGASLQQAKSEMDAISIGLAEQYPEDDKGWGVLLVPLHEELVGDVRPALWVLFGAVMLVLLIACANVANLVLARTLSRRKEVALRSALGASRGRILQAVLLENLLLALLGGALGLAISHAGVPTLIALLGDQLPRFTSLAPDASVLGFTLLVSLLTGLAAGILPALRLTGVDPSEALKQGSGRGARDAGGQRTRGALVVAEVSISLVLLVAAGLMVRTLGRLRSVDPGFDPRGALSMMVALPDAQYAEPGQRTAFFDAALERIRALPGVAAAGGIDGLPMTGGSTQPIVVEGSPDVPMSEQPEFAVRAVTAGYRDAMRIPLLRGRDLDDSDRPGRPQVVMVSESFARRFWPDTNPIGHRLSLTFDPGPREVVGVVGDVKQKGLGAILPSPTVYLPAGQEPRFALQLVVRPKAPLATLATDVAGAIATVDPEQPVTDVMTLEALLDDSLAHQRATMLLLSLFAAFALVLAAIGISSILSYSVRRRLPEIGLRVALGARRLDVLWMIVGQGLRLTVLGLALGAAGAFAATRLLEGLLYEVRPADPLTFGGVSALLTATALLACWIPARLALRVDPMTALREE